MASKRLSKELKNVQVEPPTSCSAGWKDELPIKFQSLEAENEPKGSQEDAEALDEIKDKKRRLNVVFIGHVDAGKSTVRGQILLLDQVDDCTIQKYEKEAKDKSRESWYMAYIMDTNGERIKGKTVEVGRAHFETKTTRFTILDAPGHNRYVPNMISGAAQAEIGVLVISACKEEFETGYERGGQTREHVQLAKTTGVAKLLVVVNKMDDSTVNWSKERYDEIESKMISFLRSSVYNVMKDVQFLPISGLLGTNMKTRVDKSTCPWWNGPCLFEALDSVEVPPIDPKGPFRMPIIDKFKDMGTDVMGKVESGMRSQAREFPTSSFHSEPSTPTDIDDEVVVRPPYKKAAKGKRKFVPAMDASVDKEILEGMNQFSTKLSCSSDKFSETKQRELDRKQRELDSFIMFCDISQMDDQQREFVMIQRREIIHKLRNEGTE